MIEHNEHGVRILCDSCREPATPFQPTDALAADRALAKGWEYRAVKEGVLFTKVWKCPKCAAKAMSIRPHKEESNEKK